MKVLCAAIGLLIITHPVAAQDTCPTRADLNDGTRLTDARAGYARVFVERDDGLYEGSTDGIEGPLTGVWWFRPHPILPGTRATQDGLFDMAYDSDVADIDLLPAGATWTSAVTHLSDGKTHSTGSVEVYAGGPFPLSPHRLGDCAYDILAFRISKHIEGAGSLYDEVYFAPQLGLVIGATHLDVLGAPRGAFWFDQIARDR
ncbi:hypothetical protein [Yoonia sp. R2-816]|uniref:hypothetical protein n=1 Tax=Yoonia sp. R2-816 TaxID=3342638 RepID=UPI003727CAD0